MGVFCLDTFTDFFLLILPVPFASDLPYGWSEMWYPKLIQRTQCRSGDYR